MLHSLQETKYDFFSHWCCCCCYNQMKFKQQEQQQQQEKSSLDMKVVPKRDKFHFSYLQYIYICIYTLQLTISY